tara:strand:+ start:2627 stop:3022 length:396 start_codon:yes stop_codon:yes gene_type:complete
MAKRKTRNKSGLKFRSGSEVKCADLLDKRKITYLYEPHTLAYTVEKTYLPDFQLEEYGFYIEVKGRFVSSDRSKHLRIKKTYPELDIRFMFDNPNAKLYKGSKSTNADWCIKYGYKFCKLSDGLPKEWFKK